MWHLCRLRAITNQKGRQNVQQHGHPLLVESRKRQKPCRDVRFARPRTCHRHVPTQVRGRAIGTSLHWIKAFRTVCRPFWKGTETFVFSRWLQPELSLLSRE